MEIQAFGLHISLMLEAPGGCEHSSCPAPGAKWSGALKYNDFSWRFPAEVQ